MCAGPELLFQLAILIIVIMAAVALIRLVLPSLGPDFLGGQFGQVIRILIWALIAIMVVVLIWKLFACSGLLQL